MTLVDKWQRLRSTGVVVAVGVLVTLVAGCEGGHKSTAAHSSTTLSSATLSSAARAGSKLLPLIIKPPYEYDVAPTAGATGSITVQAFAALGGDSGATTGFLAGYRQTYVNDMTGEGLTVTLVRFASSSDAKGYMAGTLINTLDLWVPVRKLFTQVPGAVEFDGTKQYNGNYAHGVVMTRGPYYAQVVYEATASSTIPIEFYDWAKVQYLNLS